nr:hypothetical protein [Acidisoma sp. L85]
MKGDARECHRALERSGRWQLNEVVRWAVEGPVAAYPDDGLTIAQNDVGRFGSAPGSLYGAWRDIRRDAFDMGTVENGEGPQHGYGLRAIFRLGRCVAIFNEHAPEEKYCRAAFAFAYLPTAVGCLLEGTEPWVAAERERRHC